jgi:dTDP-4-dehydrorhamnose 3,5-epimerase
MIFRPLNLAGACLIEIEPHEDHRGSYARSFSAREFGAHGLTATFVECGMSYTARRGTVRGMHMQVAPHAQAKLVRCSRGSIYDVILDLRRESASYGRWLAVDLSMSGRTLLYVPQGFAHGFQTLTDDVEVAYQMSAYYHPDDEVGVRWNDPRFGITWPIADVVVSERDASFAAFRD